MSLSESYSQRFGGISRLYGRDALTALSEAHFAIIGLGGVGTWAAEALARSGVGQLTLADLDDVCLTNTNRQSHALNSTIGQPKVDVLSARLKDINPEIILHSHHNFLSIKNIPELITQKHHVVIDAIDGVRTKAALISYCSALKIRLVVCGSSGGKKDPQKITVSDLGNTTADRMLSKVRGELFRKYNFSRDKNRRFRIDAVYSSEQMIYPKPDGTVCMDKSVLENGVKLDCAGGFGSSMMVTASFGLLAATKGIERYLLSRQ